MVTGGAGFIGSHLVERLTKAGHDVVVLDNLSNGNRQNIAGALDSKRVFFVNGDIREADTVKYYSKDCKIIVHFAANPDVRVGYRDTSLDFDINILGTKVVLEALRQNQYTKRIVFASTSTVYGEATVLPTPENYGPLMPISLYGGSKLACESMISAYCHMFKKKGMILRLANVIGSRANHGVIYDFVKKLIANPTMLEILGDGKQNKSYLHVSDCIDAFMIALEKETLIPVDQFNVGSKDTIDVLSLAKIVIRKLGLQEDLVQLKLNPAISGGRGWVGDVKEMLLDTSKMRASGWHPKYDDSRAAVERATEEIVSEVKG